MRNDRLIAVASNYRQQQDLHSLEDLAPGLVTEIEHFFKSYNAAKGKDFSPHRRCGPEQARELVEAGRERLRENR
jgi:inorganic pyrophosphatase